jgi:hypothetical protein
VTLANFVTPTMLFRERSGYVLRPSGDNGFTL